MYCNIEFDRKQEHMVYFGQKLVLTDQYKCEQMINDAKNAHRKGEVNMKFSYFIWDYAGTLFDTYDAVARAYHRAAQQNGIEIAFDELRWLTKHSLGLAAKQLEQRYGTAAQDILDAYYAFAPQEETLEVMRPYPGTRETLRAVCEHGGKNYLYSHRDHASIDALEHYGLKPYFSDFITKDDHFPRKPAPDALLHMISKHGLEPDRAVMVGDRVLDVQAGLNAGMQGALFDPEGFCQGQAPTPYQYASMDALRKALIEDEDVPGDTPKEECP